jgi:cellulase/cellobiase CelA1
MHRSPPLRLLGAALVPVGALVLASAAVTPAEAAAAGCSVNYSVSSQWQGGFGAAVTVTNLGDPVTSWTLTWSYTAGQTVTPSPIPTCDCTDFS